MNEAVVWYQSRAILASIAALILAALGSFGVIPASMTQDQIVNFLVVAIPIAISIHARITATKVVVGKQSTAAAINAGQPLTESPSPIAPAAPQGD